MNQKQEKVINKVCDFYFSSRDFNGISYSNLFEYSNLEEAEFKKIIEDLIRNRKIDLIYEGDIPNPHIKPFPAPPVDQQVEKLRNISVEAYRAEAEKNRQVFGSGETALVVVFASIGCCVYPSSEYLKQIVDWKKYVSRPFTLRLAKGEWQLQPYFFELGVLAIYRNDPRYRYRTDDITGSLYAVEDKQLNPSDQIFLKHFYFGFDENGTRSVAVLLCDLWKLSPEHQQIWKAKMLPGRYRFKLHPDARMGILGYYSDKCSIFTAFLEELRVTNEMARAIKGIDFYKDAFSEVDKPENFGFLILPTLREYEIFCHTLDRMMSENINEAFFDGELDVSDLDSGETLEKLKGLKIRKLRLWINKTFRIPNAQPKDNMLKTLKDVRALRSKPAHSHYVNEWNLDYYKKQRELVVRAYSAVRVIRLILTNHPRSRAVRVPEWLYRGEIRTF